MFLEDLKVGDKVVPLSHTIRDRETFDWNVKPAEHSVAWRAAQRMEQPFLYVISIDSRKEVVLCNSKNARGGDYFKEWDLEPYN